MPRIPGSALRAAPKHEEHSSINDTFLPQAVNMGSTEPLTLEQRVTRLEDMEAIKKLKARYAEFLDAGYDPEGIAGLFAEDGRWIIEGVTITGTEAIKEQCRRLVHGQPWSCHNITPSIIEIDPDGTRATGSFYMLTFLTLRDTQGKDGAFFLPGIFRDTFIKKNGRWYIQEVEAHVRQAAPWTEGWVKGGFAQGFFDLKNGE